ncbi:MAG TPA: DUF1080 domain-containing protein [Gemmataceae bacterium]|nr:DUF1080 domain-containing protein [Gemmataceae bacterium]
MLKRRRFLTGALFIAVSVGLALPPAPTDGAQADGWRPLFNGADLTGWDTWLSRPHRSVEGLPLKKNDKGDYLEPVGLNKDPKKVYTVVQEDGKPAIRISGEIFGALTSQEEFENYHLRLEFKWGEKKWPPRDKAVRDSGLLYHCVGPHGGGTGGPWMQSAECQIQEGDCGDFWSVLGVLVDVEGERKDGKGPVIYRRGGSKFTVPLPGKEPGGNRIIKSADYEKPTGQWNTIEIMVVGNRSVHLVNGKPNMVLTNIRRRVDGKEEPLTRGKIQLQSEGAEVYYRNIAIRPLQSIPEEYLK